MSIISNDELFSRNFLDLKNKIESVDLSTLSKSELQALKNYAKETQSIYKNFELVVKKDANSLYGTSASIYFSLVDFDVAEDITTSGKHSGIIVDRAINNFFVNWGEKELEIIRQFYPNLHSLRKFEEYVPDTINDVCVYGDTDSRYIDFGMIYSFLLVKDEFDFIDSVKIPDNDKELSDFVCFMMDNFINKIIQETLIEDIEYRNAKKGHLRMAHEVTTRKCVFQKKKKYVLSCIWKDGKLLSKRSLKLVGVELKRGELNKRIKKILATLVDKFLIDNYSQDQIREEVIKLFKYIKFRAEKDFIFKVSAVSGLSAIIKKEDGFYHSDKNHIQMQIALSWYNFIEKHNLHGLYRPPFEGQKMNYYYSLNDGVIGVPDDVDINKVNNLPEPDWNRMIKMILVKNILKYISDIPEVSDKDVENFLQNIKSIDTILHKI